MEYISDAPPKQPQMKNIFERAASWYKKLPDKKRHVELLTAILSVPVMISVLMLNLNSLNQSKEAANKSVQNTPIEIVITGGNPPEKPLDRQRDQLTNSPTVEPTETIALTPTQGPVITITPYPTSTPYPTYTPYPTQPPSPTPSLTATPTPS